MHRGARRLSGLSRSPAAAHGARALHVACLLFSSFAAAGAERGFPQSAQDLRDRFEHALAARDIDAAWRLYCPAATAAYIEDLYLDSLRGTMDLVVASITLEPLGDDVPSSPMSVDPLGRVMVKFDTSEQPEKLKLISMSYWYGRIGQDYCFAIPIVAEGSHTP